MAGGEAVLVCPEGAEVEAEGGQERWEAFEEFAEQIGGEGAQQLGTRKSEGTRIGHGGAAGGGGRAEEKNRSPLTGAEGARPEKGTRHTVERRENPQPRVAVSPYKPRAGVGCVPFLAWIN